MLRLFVYCFLLLVSNNSSANFLCAYKCDAKKGKHDAAEYMKNGFVSECLTECSYNKSSTYYCEFFNTLGSGSDINIDGLAKKLIETPREDSAKLAPDNNKLYALLRNFNTHKCVQHIQLMSLDQKKNGSEQLKAQFDKTLKLFKGYFEKHHPEFKNYRHLCKRKPDLEVNPSLAKARGLFDWCQNYCSKKRVPKTSKAIETLVKENINLNTIELIDLIKTKNFKFSKAKNKYITRFYKCLSQCSIKKTETYLCYFIDNIDLEKEASEATRKVLNLTAQIMMFSSEKQRHSGSKIDKYLENPDLRTRCLDSLRKHYYRGKNYVKNYDYLKKVYGK